VLTPHVISGRRRLPLQPARTSAGPSPTPVDTGKSGSSNWASKNWIPAMTLQQDLLRAGEIFGDPVAVAAMVDQFVHPRSSSSGATATG